jgi:hypothetical protein
MPKRVEKWLFPIAAVCAVMLFVDAAIETDLVRLVLFGLLGVYMARASYRSWRAAEPA